MKKLKNIKFLLPLLLVLSFAGCMPAVTITSPHDGDVFAVGEEITFSGTATDRTTGTLPDEVLIWTSDRDGEIGQGGTFTSSVLSEGVHIITLSATNDADQTGSATIQITVGNGIPGTTTTIGSTTSIGPTTTITTTTVSGSCVGNECDVFPPTITLQCVDYGVPNDSGDDIHYNDVVNVSSVYGCIYWRGAQELHVSLRNPPPETRPDYNEIFIDIKPFTGPGTYTTDPGGNILVSIMGAEADGGDTQGSLSGDDSPYKKCTIKVTSTNLHTIGNPRRHGSKKVLLTSR